MKTISFFICIVLATIWTITWDANTEPDLCGYVVYYRDYISTSYDHMNDVGNTTIYQVTMDDICAQVTAYDASHNESEKSNEACGITHPKGILNMQGE